jgi:hypothetical protein
MESVLIDCICVWLDATGEPANPGWIVSRDKIDAAGRAATTTTLDVFAWGDEAAATARARDRGRALGLPVFRNLEGATPVLIQEA